MYCVLPSTVQNHHTVMHRVYCSQWQRHSYKGGGNLRRVVGLKAEHSAVHMQIRAYIYWHYELSFIQILVLEIAYLQEPFQTFTG